MYQLKLHNHYLCLYMCLLTVTLSFLSLSQNCFFIALVTTKDVRVKYKHKLSVTLSCGLSIMQYNLVVLLYQEINTSSPVAIYPVCNALVKIKLCIHPVSRRIFTVFGTFTICFFRHISLKNKRSKLSWQAAHYYTLIVNFITFIIFVTEPISNYIMISIISVALLFSSLRNNFFVQSDRIRRRSF